MLKPLKFTPYTAKELSPSGWLRRQLMIQAAGLSGNLDKVWADVRDSKYVGGDREGWERVPYWLDGFIPLAWLLDDEDMKSRASRYVDAILNRQKPDGWICTCDDSERANYVIWAAFLICKMLVVYHDCTGDERIHDSVYRALKNLNGHIDDHKLFACSASRWFECLIPLFWLYERTPEDWMLDFAHKLCEQGLDHEHLFDNWNYTKPLDRHEPLDPDVNEKTHIVNTAMMLKSRALYSRLSGEDSNSFAKKAIRILLRDHGMAVEHIAGDEHLAGTSPIRGSELCSVIEAMYSYEWLIAINGDSEWSDRLEKEAFNALPATFSPDMWTHQYDQMTNQVQCTRFPDGKQPFGLNNEEAHLFGLEPNYGCCTANLSQGWPKFTLSAIMAAKDGVAVTAIAPCELRTKVNGTSVEIHIETDYPFEEGYTVHVGTTEPVEFTLYVRIPADVENAAIDGQPAAEGFIPVTRRWSGRDDIKISFSFKTIVKQRPSGMSCVWRGPLLYALPIETEWKKIEYTRSGVERTYPYCDYELLPKSKWNYGFTDLDFDFHVNGVIDNAIIFSPENPPVVLTAHMAEVEWAFENGACAPTPASLTPQSAPQDVTLIPYGCTNLRMTEMPVLNIR
jgi:DUF1680 family protein